MKNIFKEIIMTLRKIIAVSVCLFSTCALETMADDSLIFSASYDKSFAAEKASGKALGDVGEEINLETHDLYLQKGISGKALLTGVSDDGKKSFCCKYDANDNIKMKEGSVSFWVTPIDWNGDDKKFHIFFEAQSTGCKDRLLIYKYINSDELLFLIGPTAQIDGKSKWTIARTSVKNWKQGEYYFIACTWNSEEIKLYVNDQLKGTEKIKVPFENNSFSSFAVGGLYPKDWQNGKGKTLIDEVKIYNKVLSPKEILDEYEKLKTQPLQKAPSISIGKYPATVDGIINDGEYSFAGYGFMGLNGSLANEQSKYYLSYDDENIYIALKSPVAGKLRTECTSRDSALWTDDSVEIFLMPAPSSNDYFQLIINSKGILFDSDKKDKSWDINKIQIANKITDKEWIMEAAIPFKELRAKSPAENEKWKINICRSYPDIKVYTSISPVKAAGYSDFYNFATVTFAKDTSKIDFKSLGDILAGNFDLNIELKNEQQATENINVCADLEAKGKKHIEFKEKYQISKTKNAIASVKKKDFGTDGSVKIGITSDKSGNLYSAEITFAQAIPMEIQYIYTDIKTQIMKASVKYQKIPTKDYPALRIKILNINKKVYLEKTFTPDSQIYEVAFDISNLPPGEYEISTTILNAENNIVYEQTRIFSKPTIPAAWDNNKIGVTDEIPPPWTAINVTGNDISCWGRIYKFNNSLMPSEIVTQNKNILSSPMIFSSLQNGQIIKTLDGAVKFTDKKDNEVKLQTSANLGTLKIKSKTLVEYDGFMWMEIDIEPVSSSAKIQNLTIEIPLKSEFATLVHNCEKGYNFKHTGEGATGAISEKGWHKNIFKKPVFWVGNEDVGLEWFAADLKNWNVEDKKKSVEIISGKNETVVKLNVIDHPAEIKESIKIAFGIQATPVKPLIKDWRKKQPKKELETWFPWTRIFNYPDAKYANEKAVKEQLSWYKGKEIFWYLAIYGFTPLCPEWPYWGSQWEKIPPQRGLLMYPDSKEWMASYVCPNSKSYRDFYLWKLEKAMNEMNIKNLYFDLGVPRECYNKEHGCGWTDEKGELHETYNISGTRELVKRIYTLLKKRNPDAMLMNHMTEEPIMPVLSFCDFTADGENYCQEIAEKESYFDVFTPEVFRAAYMSRQWGYVSTFIPQFERGSIDYRKDRVKFWKTPEAQKAINHFIGYILIHDAIAWPNFGVKLDKIWKIEEQFGWDNNVKFIPYWDKTNPAKLKSPINDRTLVSAYTKPEKAMLVILNDTDKNENVSISVDMAKLVQSPKGKLTLKNPLSNEIFEVKNGEINISLEARSFKIIYIE